VADRKLSITITGDATKAKQALNELNTSVGNSETTVKKSTSGMASSLAGLGIGAAVFGAAKAYDAAAKASAQSEAVIKSTGGAAHVTAKQMDELSQSIGRKTGIDPVAITSGQNMLATFTGIRNEVGKGNDVFTQATKAAIDMSVAQGTTAVDASKLLGKALNDPEHGLTKLTRAGVVFTAQQKDQIKALQDSGDKMGAQKIILKELTTEYGGSAEAQSTAMSRAKVAVDEMAVSFGKALAPAVDVAAKGLGGLAEAFGSAPAWIQQSSVVAVAAAVGFTKWSGGIKEAASSLSGFLTGQTAATTAMEAATAAREGAVAAQAAAISAEQGFTAALGASTMAQEGLSTALASGEGIQSALIVMDVAATEESIAFGVAKGAQATAVLAVVGAEEAETIAATEAAAATGLMEAAMGPVGIALMAVAGAVAFFSSSSDDATKRTKDLQTAIDGLRQKSESTGKSIRDTFITDTLTKFGVTGGDTMKRFGVSLSDVRTAVMGTDEQYKHFMEQTVGADGTKAVNGSWAYNQRFIQSMSTLRGQLTGAEKDAAAYLRSQREMSAQTDASSGSQLSAADATKKAKAEQAAQVKVMKDLNQQWTDATNAIKGYYDASTKGITNQITFNASLDSFTKSVQTNGMSLDLNTEKGRNNEQALIAMKDAAVQSALGIREQTGSSQQAGVALQGYADRLSETAGKAGYSKGQIQMLLGSMNLLPSQITTVINANTTPAEQSLARLRSTLDGLKAGTIQVGRDISLAAATAPGVAGARAGGGPVWPGTWLVGEKGPELLHMGGNGTVSDAATTRGLMSQPSTPIAMGGGTVVHVTVNVAGHVQTERDLAESVRSGLIDIGRRTGRPVLAGF
jgi:hypothetical protein